MFTTSGDLAYRAQGGRGITAGFVDVSLVTTSSMNCGTHKHSRHRGGVTLL